MSWERLNRVINTLVTTEYDYIKIDPPSQPTTITFRKGGASGTVKATITITYLGSDPATITVS